jgi:poly(A) polymerase
LGGLSRERVRAELLKLLVAQGAAEVVAAMAGAGLLMPIIGSVPHLSRFAAISGHDSNRQSADPQFGSPAFRLAALTVVVREDAIRLRERLRLSNDEFDKIDRLAGALEGLSGVSEPPEIAALRHLGLGLGQDAVAGALALLTARSDGKAKESVRHLVIALAHTPRFLPSGRDVLAQGVSGGPMVGDILALARKAWIDADCPNGEAAQAQFVSDAVVTVKARSSNN